MRNRLSYYSVLVLLGLGIVSALVLTMNPFNSAPASAPPPMRNVSATSGASSASVGNGPAAAPPAGDGPDDGIQPGVTYGGGHHHSDDSPGTAVGGGNSTATTTATVHSQDE